MANTNSIADLSATDRDEIVERLHRFWNVWSDATTAVDEASRIYSSDDETIIWDGTPVAGPGFTEYGPLQQPFLDDIATLSNEEVGDIQVLRQGDLVVTIAQLRNVGSTNDGEEFDTTMRETLVWMRQDGDWRIIHEHSSPLPS